MSKLYRITSETINFSLVVPDSTTLEETIEEVKTVYSEIRDYQLQVAKRPATQVTIAPVNEEEEEEAHNMLGRLCADYYRSQS